MKVAIIGNGIAGITAARWLRKLDAAVEITVISDESDFFISRPALMYLYMGHMRHKDIMPYEPHFWTKNRIQLLRGRVQSIDYQQKTLNVAEPTALLAHAPITEMAAATKAPISAFSYDKLVIATGSKSNKFGWKGQDLDGVHGLYHLQDVAAMERHSANGLKRAVVVGGGLIGIEMAEMFHSRHIPVTFLVREASFWDNIIPAEESAMVNRHIREHGFDLRLQTELNEILDENNDGIVDGITTKSGEKIACGFVGLTVGVSPNVDFLKNSPLSINRGIVVNDHLETNQKDVFAIGDCAEIQNPQAGRRPIEAIWYTGKMMGEVVAYNILGKKRVTYQPKLWFNSAKFLDIEYQVYGDIRATQPDHHATIYWEHPNGKQSIRINFDKNTQAVVGFNLMGVRYRHEVCERWILTQTPIETVLENLGLANFDPEFYKEYEADVIGIYNRQFGKNLKIKTKRGLKSVLSFLGQGVS